MLDVHTWLIEKQKSQSITALFHDSWYTCYGCMCQSNKVDIDVRHFERRHEVPAYVLSYFRREARCTVN